MFSWILSLDELGLSMHLFFHVVILSEEIILGLDVSTLEEYFHGFLAGIKLTIFVFVLYLVMVSKVCILGLDVNPF